jgi:hypothetical protein
MTLLAKPLPRYPTSAEMIAAYKSNPVTYIKDTDSVSFDESHSRVDDSAGSMRM